MGVAFLSQGHYAADMPYLLLEHYKFIKEMIMLQIIPFKFLKVFAKYFIPDISGLKRNASFILI